MSLAEPSERWVSKRFYFNKISNNIVKIAYITIPLYRRVKEILCQFPVDVAYQKELGVASFFPIWIRA